MSDAEFRLAIAIAWCLLPVVIWLLIPLHDATDRFLNAFAEWFVVVVTLRLLAGG